MHEAMNKRRLPLISAVLALALLLFATRFYPGGAEGDPAVLGFDWWRVYITQLLRPVALNGQPNAARPYAVAGLWLFCLGMAELFRQLAQEMAPARHAKWVQICGIAAMVYTAFTVTRMHDLMVTISLFFFVATEVALLDWLWLRRQWPRWTAGMACLLLMLAASCSYYGRIGTAALPTLQKLVYLSSSAWLLWLHSRAAAGPAVARTRL